MQTSEPKPRFPQRAQRGLIRLPRFAWSIRMIRGTQRYYRRPRLSTHQDRIALPRTGRIRCARSPGRGPGVPAGRRAGAPARVGALAAAAAVRQGRSQPVRPALRPASAQQLRAASGTPLDQIDKTPSHGAAQRGDLGCAGCFGEGSRSTLAQLGSSRRDPLRVDPIRPAVRGHGFRSSTRAYPSPTFIAN